MVRYAMKEVRGAVIWFFCILIFRLLAADSCMGQSAPYSVLVVEEVLARVTILASNHPDSRVSIKTGFKPHEIAISPDAKIAFVSNFGLSDADKRVGTPGTTISAIDIASAKMTAELHLPEDLKAPHGLGFRPGHPEELFTNA